MAQDDTINWQWDFGDGGFALTPDANHTYITSGLKTVSLTASTVSQIIKVTKPGYINVSSVIIQPNQLPTVIITTPSSNVTVFENEQVTFSAIAFDMEDGDLASSIKWSSDVLGPFAQGPIALQAFPLGNNIVVASVRDSSGGTDLDNVIIFVSALPDPNTDPQIRILNPSANTTVLLGSSINFIASAVDAEDGIISNDILWAAHKINFGGPAVSLGTLGAGSSFTYDSLPLGDCVVSAIITDSSGATSKDAIFLTVAPVPVPNTSPVVSLYYPPGRNITTTPSSIVFLASALDLEDGDITSAINWTANTIPGSLGTGSAVTVNFSEGTNILRARAVDSSGGFGSDIIIVFVEVPKIDPSANFSAVPTSGPTVLTVDFINMTTGDASAYTWLVDNAGEPGIGFGLIGNAFTSSMSGINPTIILSGIGLYNVSLSAHGFSGAPMSVCSITNFLYVSPVSIPPPSGNYFPPFANFSALNTASGLNPHTVQFVNLTTGAASSYTWEFQPDDFITSAQHPIFTFSGFGLHDVTLSAYPYFSDDPSVCSVKGFVFVSGVAPSADFSGFPVDGQAPLTVNFRNFTTGDASSYAWLIDGTLYLSEGVVHTYTTTGLKTVSLSAFPFVSSSPVVKTKANYISVSSVGAPSANFTSNYNPNAPNFQPLGVTFKDLTIGDVSGWRWIFGDGTGYIYTKDELIASGLAASDINVNNIFEIPASYHITLSTVGPGGINVCSILNYITVNDGIPKAEFSASPLVGFSPLTVNFSSLASGNINSFEWDFGDGSVCSAPTTPFTQDQLYPAKKYSTATNQQYSPKLTATGPNGSDAEQKINYITVNALSQAPVADFSGLPLTGKTPLIVQFTDHSTNLPTSWKWNFSGLNPVQSTQQNPIHTYQTSGQKSVGLSATNLAGTDIEIKNAYINVQQNTPSPGFTANNTFGNGFLSATFTDISLTNGDPIWRRNWNFGDGVTAVTTSSQIIHVYQNLTTNVSAYTVCMSATNGGGLSALCRPNYINVNPTGVSNTTNFSSTQLVSIIDHELPPWGNLSGFYIQANIPVSANDYDPTKISWVLKDDQNRLSICQTRIAAYDADDVPRLVEIIARVGPQTGTPAINSFIYGSPLEQFGSLKQYALIASSVVTPTPNTFDPTPLTGMKLVMNAPAKGTQSPLKMFSCEPTEIKYTKTYRDGHLCKTYRYANRLDLSGGNSPNVDDRTLGVVTYVTYLSGDPTILVDMVIHNMYINPSSTLTLKEAVGDLYFKDLYLSAPTGYYITSPFPRQNSAELTPSTMVLCSAINATDYHVFRRETICMRRFAVYPANITFKDRAIYEGMYSRLGHATEFSGTVPGFLGSSIPGSRSWNRCPAYSVNRYPMPNIRLTHQPKTGSFFNGFQGVERIRRQAKSIDFNAFRFWAGQPDIRPGPLAAAGGAAYGFSPTTGLFNGSVFSNKASVFGHYGLFCRLLQSNGGNTSGDELEYFRSWTRNKWVNVTDLFYMDALRERQGQGMITLNGSPLWDQDYAHGHFLATGVSAVNFTNDYYGGNHPDNEIFKQLPNATASYNKGFCPYLGSQTQNQSEDSITGQQNCTDFQHFTRYSAPIMATLEYVTDAVLEDQYELMASFLHHTFSNVQHVNGIGGNTIGHFQLNAYGLSQGLTDPLAQTPGLPVGIGNRGYTRTIGPLAQYYGWAKGETRIRMFEWAKAVLKIYSKNIPFNGLWGCNALNEAQSTVDVRGAGNGGTNPGYAMFNFKGYLAQADSVFTIFKIFKNRGGDLTTMATRLGLHQLSFAKGYFFGDMWRMGGTNFGSGSNYGNIARSLGEMAVGWNNKDTSIQDTFVTSGDTSMDFEQFNASTIDGVCKHPPNQFIPFPYLRRFGDPNGAGKNGTGSAEGWLFGRSPHPESSNWNTASSVLFSGIHPFQGEPTAYAMNRVTEFVGVGTTDGTVNNQGTWLNDQGHGRNLYFGAVLLVDLSGSYNMTSSNPFFKRALEWNTLTTTYTAKFEYGQNEKDSQYGSGAGIKEGGPLWGIIERFAYP